MELLRCNSFLRSLHFLPTRLKTALDDGARWRMLRAENELCNRTSFINMDGELCNDSTTSTEKGKITFGVGNEISMSFREICENACWNLILIFVELQTNNYKVLKKYYKVIIDQRSEM